jgi:hypothetical protein
MASKPADKVWDRDSFIWELLSGRFQTSNVFLECFLREITGVFVDVILLMTFFLSDFFVLGFSSRSYFVGGSHSVFDPLYQVYFSFA